jgi:hypothetical protein
VPHRTQEHRKGGHQVLVLTALSARRFQARARSKRWRPHGSRGPTDAIAESPRTSLASAQTTLSVHLRLLSKAKSTLLRPGSRERSARLEPQKDRHRLLPWLLCRQAMRNRLPPVESKRPSDPERLQAVKRLWLRRQQ